jgi:hypothetical protein
VTRRGVLYIATGAAHLRAARASAASVRRSNPGLKTAVFTEVAGAEGFDRVMPIRDAHYRSKVDHMHRSPFDVTLYLDGDTRVFGDLGPVFRLADRFDMALAQVARFWARGYQVQWRHAVPATFPQLNTGVMLFRGTPAVRTLFGEWRGAYYAAGAEGDDQRAFRELVWLSDLRLAVLPGIYNARRYTWGDRLLSHRPAPVILHSNRFHPTKAGGPVRRRLAALATPPLGDGG